MRQSQSSSNARSSDRWLLCEAGVVLAGVRVLLWLVPFGRLLRILEWTARRSAGVVLAPLPENWEQRMAGAVVAAARYVPRSTCLTQALAAQWLLARSGCPTLLRIGVATGPDKVFKAHAWLEREGRVVLGGEALEVEEYAPLPLPCAEAVWKRHTGAAVKR
jgi:hypothetical protein